MPRVAQSITLESVDRLELERWVAAHGTPPQVTQRCQIILAAADGLRDQEIAEDLQIDFKTVALWRGRFRKEGVESLWESRPQARLFGRAGGRRHCAHVAKQTARGHALELPHDGPGAARSASAWSVPCRRGIIRRA